MKQHFAQVVFLSALFLATNADKYTPADVLRLSGAPSGTQVSDLLNQLARNCATNGDCDPSTVEGLQLKDSYYTGYDYVGNNNKPFVSKLRGQKFTHIGYAEDADSWGILYAGNVVPPFNFQQNEMLSAFNKACGASATTYDAYTGTAQSAIDNQGGDPGNIDCPSGSRGGGCFRGYICRNGYNHDEVAQAFKKGMVDRSGKSYANTITHIAFAKASDSGLVCAVFAQAEIAPTFNFNLDQMISAFNAAVGCKAKAHAPYSQIGLTAINTGRFPQVPCPPNTDGTCEFYGGNCVTADSHEEAAKAFASKLQQSYPDEMVKISYAGFASPPDSGVVCGAYAVATDVSTINVDFQAAFKGFKLPAKASYNAGAERIAQKFLSGTTVQTSDISPLCRALGTGCRANGGCDTVLSTDDAVKKLKQYVPPVSRYVGFARKGATTCVCVVTQM